MTEQEQFEADYLAAFKHEFDMEFARKIRHSGAYYYSPTFKAFGAWQQQAARHKAEIAELVSACKGALYALKGREHDQFLRDVIKKYEGQP